MKFRVEREGLADAVTWAARSLSTRPTMPVLAGLLLSVSGDVLVISGFDLEASTEVELEVSAGSTGQALVSGRLLADITKALPPHPVDVAVDGSRLTISCGSARFTLPTMPGRGLPAAAVDAHDGRHRADSADFANAVSQVAIAAGRDDTLPMLTGVRLEIEGSKITLAATDRYRLAVREFGWTPENPVRPSRSRCWCRRAPSPRPCEEPLAQRHHDDRAVASRRSGPKASSASRARRTAGLAGRPRACSMRRSRPTGRCCRTSGRPRLRSTSARSSRPSSGWHLVADRNTPVRLEFGDGGELALCRPAARTRAEPRSSSRWSTTANRSPPRSTRSSCWTAWAR